MASTSENSVSYELPVQVENLPEPISRSVAAYQNKIAGYLLEVGRLRGLERLAVDHRLPARFHKYFQKAMDLYDESLQLLLSYLRDQGFAVRCHPQCSHCCYHMPIGISAAELVYLYCGMQRSGLMERFFRRCMEADQAWRATLVRRSKALEDPQVDHEYALEAALADYHRMEQPCPFLQNHLCQLYSYRPLACRMHFSVSPPYWCHPAHFHNPQAVRFNLEPGECVVQGLNRLDDRLQLPLSDIMISGLLELTVNIMRFEQIRWLQ